MVYFFCCVFFFKQKTAYEMRISDWSSDVCSSDLPARHHLAQDELRGLEERHRGQSDRRVQCLQGRDALVSRTAVGQLHPLHLDQRADRQYRPGQLFGRSEARREGKACVSTCRSGWPPCL